MKTRLPFLSALLSLLPILLCPGHLVAERMEARLQVIAEGLAPRMVLVTPDMVTNHGTVDVSDLFFEEITWLGMTTGLSNVFQGTLAYEPLPNTLEVSDGVFQWSQAEGSSAPGAFSVTYSPATRTLFVIYLESLPPPAGRNIFASQLVEIVLGGEDSIGMHLTGDGGSAPAEIFGQPHPGSGGLEIGWQVSGDLRNWQPVAVAQGMITDKGGIDLTDQIFQQRKPLLFTDGSDTVFRGKLLERPQAGTLALTDGVYHWSEAGGSDSPADFSIIYAPLTGTVVTVYQSEIPESGREIAVSYDVTVANANAAFFRAGAANPVLEITGDLVFGPTGVGASSTQTIVLSNTGLGLLVIHGITLPEGFSVDWTSGPIAPGESREVTLTFNPTEVLEYNGTLSIESNALAGVETFEVSGEILPVPNNMVLVESGMLQTDNELNGTVVSTFEISRYEVTWGEWKEVRTYAAANGYDIGGVGAGCADDHPVHSVSWYDVVKWCNAKSEMEGLPPVYTVSGGVYRTGETIPGQNLLATGYRLPLEAEWEFAARGGRKNQSNGWIYAGSSNLNEVGWYDANSGGAGCNLLSGRGTWPVGEKAANELGLYDMSGNVLEWCWDSIGSFRRLRGGSWINAAGRCAVSYRDVSNPDLRYSSDGFRLARSSGN
jgi:formylglycine-generating enzyme